MLRADRDAVMLTIMGLIVGVGILLHAWGRLEHELDDLL